MPRPTLALSAIAGDVGGLARVLDLDDVSPGVGLAAVEIGEAVNLRQLPAGQGLPVPARHVGFLGETATARPTKAGLSEMAKWADRAVASRQFASVTP